MSALIEIHDLVKEYEDLRAVDGLSLELQEGEVYGFLGPNGSGKSTTILTMLGLTEPTSGTVAVCGHDPAREPLEVKRQVGYLPESVGFYGDLTGRQNMDFTAALNRIPRVEANARIQRMLNMVELGDAADRPVGHYSRGMRQRLGLADVLLKEPRLVILDDPTLGLDPAGIQWLLGMIEELSTKQGITVFLSSHQLHEVQQVCDRVGIMSHGKLVLEGTVDDLTAEREGGGYEVNMDVRGGTGLRETLAALPGVTRCDISGSSVAIEADRDVRADAVAAAVSAGAAVLEVRSELHTLQDIYLRYFQVA